MSVIFKTNLYAHCSTEPKSVDIASLDESLILKEKDIYKEQLISSGKPDDIIEKNYRRKD